jgi:molybdopterin-guanine dinucleotide biosynthesis protein A
MFTVVIQAGGESRRMGQDKGLLTFMGQPLVARAMERLAPIADEAIVTTNRPQDYAFLGVPLFTDRIPGRGALGGLYTALSAARYPYVAVVACDMPFVNPRLLAAQRDLLARTQSDIVIPHLEGGIEPFHAVYRRQICLPPIEEALAADKWRADAWFHRVKVYLMRGDEIVKYDPALLSFWNVNTPEEIEEALQIARRLEENS